MAWYFYVLITESQMFALLIVAVVFVAGVITGAYSHKWLAKETGAPVNITASAAGIASAATKVEQTVAKKV